MELWIRSQDKEELMKVDYLYIPISRTGEHFGIYTKVDVRDELLGLYKTKERALEVLDEIDNVKWWKYMASLNFEIFISFYRPSG